MSRVNQYMDREEKSTGVLPILLRPQLLHRGSFPPLRDFGVWVPTAIAVAAGLVGLPGAWGTREQKKNKKWQISPILSEH